MFLAHRNDIKPGSWQVLNQTKGTKTLLNNDGTYCLQSNICTHQGSKIRTGAGSGLATVCPYHGYSWNKDGSPRASGLVGHANGSVACENKKHLETSPVYEWSGFLFSEPVKTDLDLSGNYQLEEYRKDTVASSHIAIMDLFLDVDHIPTVHRGLYDAIDITEVKNIQWKNWPGGSVQIVPSSQTEQGAVWMAQYPGTMFEWQPGAVFITVNQPLSDDTTQVHVFKYRDLDYPESTWKLNEGIWETAWQQDRNQSEMLEPGWRCVNINNLDPEKQYFRQYVAKYQHR